MTSKGHKIGIRNVTLKAQQGMVIDGAAWGSPTWLVGASMTDGLYLNDLDSLGRQFVISFRFVYITRLPSKGGNSNVRRLLGPKTSA